MWASAVYKATLLSAFYCLVRYFFLLYFSCSALHWEVKLNGATSMVWKLRKRRNVRDLYISLNAFKHNVIVSWWQRKREEKRNRLNNLMEKEVFNLKWVCKFIPSHFSCISSVCVDSWADGAEAFTRLTHSAKKGTKINQIYKIWLNAPENYVSNRIISL